LHEAGYQTIGVQPRGIDGSTLPELGISLHTLSDDVVAVLDTEGITEPVHILGHAYGNRIARTFATDYPERTASLVLLAAGGVEPTPPETGKAISQALFGIGSSASRKEAVHFAFFAKASSVPDHWLRGFYPMAGLAQARAMTNTRPEEWSAGGDARILVLEPSEDAAASGGGELLRAAHPHRVTLIRVDNAGHALLPEQPDVVAREVIGYLGETL
jgi:pimeloyl-ACP methyl ester carboxylesterase